MKDGRRSKLLPAKRKKSLRIVGATDHQDGWEEYVEVKWKRINKPIDGKR